MKISTGLIYRRAVDQMGSAQGKLAQMQAQLSSGRAVVKASDAPEQATAIQRLKSVIARQDGFEQNLQTTENRLGLEEAVLSSATTILARVKELAIQAANDSNSPTDRQILAIEIDELRGELLAAGNSKDVNGNYIFAGSRVKKPAFYTDPRGDVVYQGDQTRNLVDVGENRQIFMNRPGSDIFTQVPRTQQDGSVKGIGFFKALDDLSMAMKTSDRVGIDQGVADLDEMQKSMTLAIAKVGSGMTVVDSQKNMLEEVRLQLKTALSNIEDINYAEAVTDMKKKIVSLEAAQSSFAQISNLNLFDYISR